MSKIVAKTNAERSGNSGGASITNPASSFTPKKKKKNSLKLLKLVVY